MADPGLIVAIVFSCLFGAIVLWLAVYYVHRWIHRQCCAIENFFLSNLHKPREDYGKEFGRRRSPSPGMAPPPRSRSSRSRSRRGSSPRESSKEEAGELLERATKRRPEHLEMFPPRRREYPRLDFMDRNETFNPRSQAFPPRLMPPVQMLRPAYMSPIVRQQVYPRPLPARQSEHSIDIGPSENPESEYEAGSQRQSIHEGIDYIEYGDPPAWILGEPDPVPDTEIDEVEGDGDESAIEQIPRAYIPRSVPRANLQYSQPFPPAFARLRSWEPVSIPHQEHWTGRIGTKRYAPYAKPNRRKWKSKLRNADRRPLFPIFETPFPIDPSCVDASAETIPRQSQPPSEGYKASGQDGSRQYREYLDDTGGPELDKGNQTTVEESKIAQEPEQVQVKELIEQEREQQPEPQLGTESTVEDAVPVDRQPQLAFDNPTTQFTILGQSPDTLPSISPMSHPAAPPLSCASSLHETAEDESDDSAVGGELDCNGSTGALAEGLSSVIVPSMSS
ncbi:hypothetical protein CC78DRAFT_574454 [Lojkania enalia]|uniref:Uncharacterized protein n=1 Tax=Lojkania enalia TaxID=147567 RepID=A0A9P4NBT8_9PLEO|nr:hypothetical protein CC78DRAFT_574454 [Didymosphaeria enalia]